MRKLKKGYYGYSNYQFRDKDPDIDKLRTAIQTAATIAGVKFGVMCKRIAEGIGMSPNTLWNWFEGSTVMPRHAGIQAVAKWLRMEFVLVSVDQKVVRLSDYRRGSARRVAS